MPLTEKAMSGVPRSGLAHFKLGQLHQAEARLPEALAAFRESARLEPVVGRDNLYLTIGSLSVNHADFDGAVAAYIRRVDVNPNSADAHRQLGEVYFLQGRDDEALAEFSVAAFLAPANAKAHAGHGQVLLRLRRYADAAAAFGRAVARGDDQPEARYSFGVALMRAGKNDDGRKEIETSQRLRAEAAARGQRDFELDALRRAAARAQVDGQHDRAIALLHDVLAAVAVGTTAADNAGLDNAAPDNSAPRAYRDIGLALLSASRASDAVAYLEKAQQVEPTAEGAGALADVHRALGRDAERERYAALAATLIERRKVERLQALAGGR
jgi:tetratricopeptide (TPR) repeat protein